MKAYQEQDFDKMAAQLVDKFMAGEKLADVAAMQAQQEQLNPDQIERMVQAANTMAFLRLMEQQKSQGGHDMTSEFDPIDTRQIMQQMISQTPNMSADAPHGEMPMGGAPQCPPGMEPQMAPHPDMGPLPDEMGAAPPQEEPAIDDENDGPFPKGSKDTKAKDKKPVAKAKEKDEAKEAMCRQNRMRKLADILEDQYRQAELTFEDTFADLHERFKVAYNAPNTDTFEKDALVLCGDEIGVSVLNLVKEAQGLPAITVDDANVKTAGLQDHYVVDDTAVNRTFERLVKIATEAARLQKAVEHVRTQCS